MWPSVLPTPVSNDLTMPPIGMPDGHAQRERDDDERDEGVELEPRDEDDERDDRHGGVDEQQRALDHGGGGSECGSNRRAIGELSI